MVLSVCLQAFHCELGVCNEHWLHWQGHTACNNTYRYNRAHPPLRSGAPCNVHFLPFIYLLRRNKSFVWVHGNAYKCWFIRSRSTIDRPFSSNSADASGPRFWPKSTIHRRVFQHSKFVLEYGAFHTSMSTMAMAYVTYRMFQCKKCENVLLDFDWNHRRNR